MSTTSRTPLPQYITTLIQITVKRTLGRYRFSDTDRDDLEQQIAMEVVRRRSKFDPAKAQENTFLARMVKHAIADIIAARKAGNRDYRRENGSLDEWVKDASDNWERRADMITEEDATRHVGPADTSQEDLHDLAIDLASAVSRLSPKLREIFERYAELGSPRKVAKAVGVHHSTVYEALKQIKEHLTAAGLTIYLPKSRTNPTDSGARR